MSADLEQYVLTKDAVSFVTELQRTFGKTITQLLSRRRDQRLDFLPETKHIREGKWTCAEPPRDIRDRRVEITGPVDKKMIINALGSGARVFMADFEDATTPTWSNVVAGQRNLYEAVRRTLAFDTPEKKYRIGDRAAVLFVRPRGLHLPEKHFVVDGEPSRGALVDFGLFAFHNAKELVARGTRPYFYLPKLESHLEARLWNVVFLHAERVLGLPQGTIRATVLIETLPAAFEMHEILYELREHSAGLNCGRWDYIFSFIKKQSSAVGAVLPDRSLVTMDKGFLNAYSRLLIETCHRRGVHAMGGMAAQIPIKNDPKKNEEALAKVRADKLREVKAGHDGTWVAHPGLVPIATEIFDAHMKGENQIGRIEPANVTRADLLRVPEGARTIEGVRTNVRVAIQYIASWLRGQGCVPLYGLMEDAATAEISRAQLWQWLHHHAAIENRGAKHSGSRRSLSGAWGAEPPISIEMGGSTQTPFTEDRYRAVVDEEMAQLGPGFDAARRLLDRLVLARTFEEFLTLPAYEELGAPKGRSAEDIQQIGG